MKCWVNGVLVLGIVAVGHVRFVVGFKVPVFDPELADLLCLAVRLVRINENVFDVPGTGLDTEELAKTLRDRSGLFDVIVAPRGTERLLAECFDGGNKRAVINGAAASLRRGTGFAHPGWGTERGNGRLGSHGLGSPFFAGSFCEPVRVWAAKVLAFTRPTLAFMGGSAPLLTGSQNEPGGVGFSSVFKLPCLLVSMIHVSSVCW